MSDFLQGIWDAASLGPGIPAALKYGFGVGNEEGASGLQGFGNDWKDILFGTTEQQVPEYTAAQQEASDAAYGQGAAALNSFQPQGYDFSQYENFLKGVNPGNLFSSVSDPSQYQAFIDASLGQAGQSLESLGNTRATEAANQAASAFNLQGPGGLYSGAAAKGIGEGAARAQQDATLQYAQLKNSAMQNLLGQNLASQGQELGYQTQGYGNLAGLGSQFQQGLNQQELQKQQYLAQLYGQQGGGYDTTATFAQGPGLVDIANLGLSAYNTAQGLG